jgi:hypothetical protein
VALASKAQRSRGGVALASEAQPTRSVAGARGQCRRTMFLSILGVLLVSFVVLLVVALAAKLTLGD